MRTLETYPEAVELLKHLGSITTPVPARKPCQCAQWQPLQWAWMWLHIHGYIEGCGSRDWHTAMFFLTTKGRAALQEIMNTKS